jgi:prepilin-type N-terminal cleavage/methylation domain-containing protein
MVEYQQFTRKPVAARALLHPDPGGFAMKDRRGFTLLEIMIVIAIVGIMAIVATTNLQLWQNHYSGVGFQREFLSQVNEARTRTMATSLQHRLLIEKIAGRVTLQRWDSVNNAWPNAAQPIVGSRGAGIENMVYTPGGTVSTDFALLFNPDGEVLVQTTLTGTTASPLTEADVHLSASSATDRATIRVFGWTSKARLVNGWL